MLEQKEKKKIKPQILIIIALFIMLLAVLGTTFAYFTATITGNDTESTSVITKTATLGIVYEAGQNLIADQIMPGDTLPTKTWTVTNTGTMSVTYKIIWKDVFNNFVGTDLKYSVVGSGTGAGQKSTTIAPASGTSDMITNITIGAGQTQTYTLTMTFENTAQDQNQDQGKTFNGKIEIQSEGTIIDPCPNCGTVRLPENNPTETSTFLNSPAGVTRNKIESIEFATTNVVPGGVIGSWDVSANNDSSVMGWYTDTNSNSLYEVTIGSTGGVEANSSSTALFKDIRNLNTLNFENFYTMNVISMGNMFYYAGYNSTVFTLDVSNFDTSKVTNMSGMFANTGENCNVFTVDVSNFDTSNVIYMNYMFIRTGYSNPTFTLDVSNFDTSNVISMEGMFNRTGYVNPTFMLDVSSFDTSKVTNMIGMFAGAGYNSTTYTLDLNNFNTSNVTDMEYMFETAGNSNPNFTLNIKNGVFDNVTTYTNMFSGSKSTHKVYVKDAAAVNFIDPKTSATVINCSTTACP